MRVSNLLPILMVGSIIIPAWGVPPGSGVTEPTVSLTIDAANPGAVISPLLFGHNLEHTRRGIWQGISAEMLANRKFAAVDGGLPMRWNTLAGSGVSVDDQATYAGKHSVRLDNTNASACGIFQQQEWLTFRKGTKYAFRIWTKSEANQTLRLQILDRAGFNFIFNADTIAKSGDWHLWSGEFESPFSVTGARFKIQLVTAGSVRIGAMSLMPADNIHGMRRDVVDLFKQLKPGCLRWPGGCFAEYYNWKDGLLPVDQRAPIGPGQWAGQFTDTDGYDNHEIGIDEFIALCRELKSAPQITTRFSEGSPEEAGSWVEYCNGSITTQWGKLRAARGHLQPYGVKYWYMGNELTGMSLLKGEGKTNPKILAGLCRPHIEAMKKADPSIEINVGLPGGKEWLDPLIAEAGGMLSQVQVGFYFGDATHEVAMSDVLKTPTQVILPQLKSLRKLLDNITPSGKHLGIAYYEWNVNWDRPEGDVLGGVFAAEMLNMFCREMESLDLAWANYFMPISEGSIKVNPTTCELQPDGQVFVLYSAHQGNRLLKPSAMTDMDLCASMAPDGKSVIATVINQSTKNERTLELSLTNFPGLTKASANLLIPMTLEAGGKFVQREEELAVTNGNKVVLALPPCGIARIRLEKKCDEERHQNQTDRTGAL